MSKKTVLITIVAVTFCIGVLILVKPIPCQHKFFCRWVGCVKDGDYLPYIGAYSPKQLLSEPEKCCLGLKLLRSPNSLDKNCRDVIADGGLPYFCTSTCGNGKCEGLENKCNCPFDCKEQ